MTAVDTVTGEIVEVMDLATAEKVTRDIKAWAGTLWLKIEEAHRGRAWLPLGYETWEAYLDAEFDISRSRGYQLVAHAQAVRTLAAAAGVDVSTIVDIPEGQTRGVDPSAVAADVEKKVTTTTTTEERTETLRSTLAAHAEFAKRAKASQSPPTPPGDETSADALGGPAEEPASDGADEADEDMSDPSADPEEDGGDGPATDPPSPPDDLEDDAVTVADLYPEETYRINADKAVAKIYEQLAVLNASRLRSGCSPEQWADFLAFAAALQRKATEFAEADTGPNLRSVQ